WIYVFREITETFPSRARMPSLKIHKVPMKDHAPISKDVNPRPEAVLVASAGRDYAPRNLVENIKHSSCDRIVSPAVCSNSRVGPPRSQSIEVRDERGR